MRLNIVSLSESFDRVSDSRPERYCTVVVLVTEKQGNLTNPVLAEIGYCESAIFAFKEINYIFSEIVKFLYSECFFKLRSG